MNYIIDGTQLTAIADAIREKTGESNIMTVDEMPDEISGISGGIPVLTESQWNSLTTAQKQSYNLVAIRDKDQGFERGILVNGADYVEKTWDFTVVKTGSTSGAATYEFEESGTYQLFMIAINSEASTFNLNNAASLNDNAIVGEDMKYNTWDGSQTDKRNYRVTKFEFDANANDTLSFQTSNVSSYTTTIYAIIKSDIASLVKSLSTADDVASGICDEQAIVMYGTSNSNAGGTIAIEAYSPGALITTPSPGQSYKSSYIFWFGI